MIPSADTILSRFVVRAKFRHMQVLIKLIELGSMRRAAEAVNMTQPAISQLVSELEKLLGADLFFRHAKGVAPTDVAKDLLPVAHRVLLALQDGSESIASRLKSQSGVVRVAASPAAIGGLLLETLGPFSQAQPDIQVHVIENSGVGHIDMVLADQADIVCTRKPQIIPEGWEFLPCLEDKLVVVCGSKHPLATQSTVTPNDLGQFKWLMNRVGSVARQKFEDAFKVNDWPDKVRGSLTLHVPELTRGILLNNDHLAILPQSVARPWLRSNVVKELDTELTETLPPLGILRPETRNSAATSKFTGFMMQHLSST